MKCIIVLLMTVLAGNFSANAQNELKPANAEPRAEQRIKQFWFVMLLKGNNRTQDSATAVKLQEGHMANIGKLYKEGKLKVAGPFGDDGNWRGVFIFDVTSKEEVELLLKGDPAIAAGRLSYEIHPWYTAPVGSFATGKPVKSGN
ncbi:MAG TPA: YciI family protein [Ferruginibacter sp.]|mgnify:CR=1 FL=1|nr:YciI family protein [Ferruginibacter sp.]HPH91723.1 YciI family protein [Ferruginibacter sp.]